MALAQGDQAACVEVVVRPALVIAPTPAPFAPMALAQDASETSAHINVPFVPDGTRPIVCFWFPSVKTSGYFIARATIE
jgi:hypothetical protein